MPKVSQSRLSSAAAKGFQEAGEGGPHTTQEEIERRGLATTPSGPLIIPKNTALPTKWADAVINGMKSPAGRTPRRFGSSGII